MRTGLTPTRSMRNVVAVFLLSIAVSSCSLFKSDDAPSAADLAEVREQEISFVAETVVDANRSEAFLQLIARRDALFEEQRVVTREHIVRIEALAKNYRSSRSDFDALFVQYNASRTGNQHRYVEIVGEMKNVTTRDEWKAISKYQLKYLDARRLVYQSQVESE